MAAKNPNLRFDANVRSLLQASPSDKSIALFEIEAGLLFRAFGTTPTQFPERSRLSSRLGKEGAHFLRDLIATYQIMGRRLTDLTLDLFAALNGRRILASTLVGRALLESTALSVYSAERLEALTKQARTGSFEERIAFVHRITSGGRFDWSRLRSPTLLADYAKAPTAADEPKPPEAVTAFNVMTVIRVLDDAVARKMPEVKGVRGSGVVRATYAILSDFCHPAVGSTMLYFRPSTAVDTFVADLSMRDEQLRGVWTWLSVLTPALACSRDAINGMAAMGRGVVAGGSPAASPANTP